MLEKCQITPIRFKFSASLRHQPSVQTMATEDLSVWMKRQLSRVTEDFEAADKDKNGYLSFAEILDVLKTAGFKGSDEEAKTIFRAIDKDHNDRITKAEFTTAMSRVPKIDFKVLVLRRAFNKMDTDHSGYLSKEEIIQAANSDVVGLNVTAEKIADMLSAYVKDEDKKIYYDEFLDIWAKNRISDVMRQLFQRLDKDKSGSLSKDEMIAGIKTEPELNIRADVIAQGLIKWCKRQTIDYEQFCKFYAQIQK